MVTDAAITGRIEDAIRPSLERFEAARAAQRSVAGWFEVTSPALLTHRLLADAAGSGEAAHTEFRAGSIDYHRRVRDTLLTATMAGPDLGPSELAAIPRFTPPGGLPLRGHATATGLLVAASGLLAWLGARRLSRHDVAL